MMPALYTDSKVLADIETIQLAANEKTYRVHFTGRQVLLIERGLAMLRAEVKENLEAREFEPEYQSC